MPVYTITVQPTGSAGSASGTAQTSFPFSGVIGAITIDATSGTIPTTADITIDMLGAITQNVLTLTNIGATGTTTVWRPQALVHDSNGTIQTSRTPYFAAGQHMQATFAQADPGTFNVRVHVLE
jgi:hypothetical protein